MTTPAAAAELLFGDSLTCEELRPAAFVPRPRRADPVLAASGEALLRALAVVEDGPRTEEPETGDHALPRIEAKLDLLTTLVASLCRHEDTDPVRFLQWSARGACLLLSEPPPDAPEGGLFRVRPADWLPSTLQLPATEIAREQTPEGLRCWLRFDPLPPALEAALERHLFRIHRRAVAESRRPRQGS
ncbi:PilZ domain-containing protein [Luteimonas kalidii]|uniref:PilZ domain-containing protein n=1 Tax=Luteimonas kalidii TaxID=3042025 RepID=A0ABT6JW92_9GAMM|nr:PilZ domain-containing protein [Luteimonas kalidii]MDH5834955.1 PilZ domain-containing protein [Luteimonas kalidii]